MRSRRVGLVTSAELGRLTDDDRLLLVPELARLGIAAVPAVWGEPAPVCDALVVRSPWDYVHARDAFLAWLDAQTTPVWNPPALVRWNTDKRYLMDLERRGVTIVPTVLIPPGARVDPAAHGFGEAVAKPVVSINALGARRVRAGETFVAEGDAPTMLQPFLHEVTTSGERSFVFVDGELTHAVVKLPRAGDFRVQEAHGGAARLDASPDPELVREARAVLDALDATPLYARVDGVLSHGKLMLMELEVTEPSLYLEHAPSAAATLAGAIARRLQSPGAS